jgi:hypothetical protein
VHFHRVGFERAQQVELQPFRFLPVKRISRAFAEFKEALCGCQ